MDQSVYYFYNIYLVFELSDKTTFIKKDSSVLGHIHTLLKTQTHKIDRQTLPRGQTFFITP